MASRALRLCDVAGASVLGQASARPRGTAIRRIDARRRRRRSEGLKKRSSPMCGVCGCGQAEVVLEKGKAGETDRGADVHEHDHGDGHGPHSHPHDRRRPRNRNDADRVRWTGAQRSRWIREKTTTSMRIWSAVRWRRWIHGSACSSRCRRSRVPGRLRPRGGARRIVVLSVTEGEDERFDVAGHVPPPPT